jgi:hypothetical protein
VLGLARAGMPLTRFTQPTGPLSPPRTRGGAWTLAPDLPMPRSPPAHAGCSHRGQRGLSHRQVRLVHAEVLAGNWDFRGRAGIRFTYAGIRPVSVAGKRSDGLPAHAGVSLGRMRRPARRCCPPHTLAGCSVHRGGRLLQGIVRPAHEGVFRTSLGRSADPCHPPRISGGAPFQYLA